MVKDNVASIRVMENCGFTICGEDTELSQARGEDVEGFELILRADEYLATA